MAIKTFATGEVLTASDTNTYLANSGLVYVTQATVGNAVSAVNITSCLSSTYDNYVVSYANVTASNNGSIMACKLLVGTTPTTAGWYGNTFYVINAGTGGLSNANNVNSSYAECGSLTNTFKNAATFEILQPNLATQSMLNYTSTDNNYMRIGGFVLNNSTSYDGIQLAPFSGTITGGTITVYGYRKA
jgi:hypothetical protein